MSGRSEKGYLPQVRSGAAGRGLVRPRRGKLVAGVLAGLAQRFDVSPSTARSVFLVSMLLPGPQMLVYLVLWVIMPREAGAISRGGRCHSKADSPSSQSSALQRMGHRHPDKGASLVPKREALLFERRLVAKHLVLVPGLLVSVLLSGCGASDEEQVRETIKRFNRAAAEGDGKEACDQLTPGAQATGGLRCESVIDQLGRLGGKAAKRRLAAVEVRNVTVSGKTAMAEAQVPTQSPTMLQLEKVPRRVFRWKTSDGEWKIASLGPGPGGGF